MTEIRVLRSADWEEVRDVRLRALADAPDAFTSTLDGECAYDEEKWRSLAESGRWFVADDSGELVGIGVPGWSDDPNERELIGMWVAKSHRRLGIASELLEHVRAWAASQGATILKLGVREGNEAALTAYLTKGLRRSGETMPDVAQPSRAIVMMECALDPG
jgi:GNAT superfamily N-acetyltransferase